MLIGVSDQVICIGMSVKKWSGPILNSEEVEVARVNISELFRPTLYCQVSYVGRANNFKFEGLISCKALLGIYFNPSKKYYFFQLISKINKDEYDFNF
jgi:hypothetical protein